MNSSIDFLYNFFQFPTKSIGKHEEEYWIGMKTKTTISLGTPKNWAMRREMVMKLFLLQFILGQLLKIEFREE